jgi:agmatine/peptidylarginine deiminase
VNGGDERRFRRLAKDYFNVDDVFYLRPLPNSIWHIDMFFKLARPGVVLLGEFGRGQATQSEYLDALQHEAAEVLAWNRRLIEARFPGVDVVPVPMPPIIYADHAGAGGAGQTGLPQLDAAVESNGASVTPLATVVYRSFLNSLVLNGAGGRSAVVVPSFSGLEGMTSGVEAAYRRAFPGADIYFLNADALVEEFGGIHCVTVTIPSFDLTKKAPAHPALE